MIQIFLKRNLGKDVKLLMSNCIYRFLSPEALIAAYHKLTGQYQAE